MKMQKIIMKKNYILLFLFLVNVLLCFSQDKQQLKVNSFHSMDIKSVCVSPDGKYALTASDDKTIKLW